MGYGHAKKELFAAFMEFFGPMRKRHQELAANLGYVEEVLQTGATRARALAQETMEAVREATGIARRLE